MTTDELLEKWRSDALHAGIRPRAMASRNGGDWREEASGADGVCRNAHAPEPELYECEHQFTFYGYAPDGTCFFRCRKCKKQTDE